MCKLSLHYSLFGPSNLAVDDDNEEALQSLPTNILEIILESTTDSGLAAGVCFTQHRCNLALSSHKRKIPTCLHLITCWGFNVWLTFYSFLGE